MKGDEDYDDSRVNGLVLGLRLSVIGPFQLRGGTHNCGHECAVHKNTEILYEVICRVQVEGGLAVLDDLERHDD